MVGVYYEFYGMYRTEEYEFVGLAKCFKNHKVLPSMIYFVH